MQAFAQRQISSQSNRPPSSSVRAQKQAKHEQQLSHQTKPPSSTVDGHKELAKNTFALQAKLKVNKPGDVYEQEADRVADRVMRMPDRKLQRTCACGGTCPKCSAEGQEIVQTKRASGSNYGQTAAPPIVDRVVRSPGQPLDKSTRNYMEPRFGRDLSSVRIHNDAMAAESAHSINAKAYTVGRDVVFGAGAYRPGTAEGGRLLAHELTHVFQQRGLGESVQRQPAGPAPTVCPKHEPREVRDSRTDAGHIYDIWELGGGQLLIADFGVGRTGVKKSTAADPALVAWLQRFESDSSYKLKIVGYDDCSGTPGQRVNARTGRAQQVLAMLGSSAKSRVSSTGPAALNSYINDNTTVQHRAQNRGVVIEYTRLIKLPPTNVTVTKKKVAPPTNECTKTQKSELANALPLAKDMVDNALGVMGGPWTPALKALLRKYFNDDSASTFIRVIAGLKKIKSGLKVSVTYECEQPGSLFFDEVCGGSTAYVWAWIGFKIHMCPDAFGRSNSALAETIVHENSHMFDHTSLDKYCNLSSGCSSGLSRWDAYDNADSFSTFAQDAYFNLP